MNRLATSIVLASLLALSCCQMTGARETKPAAGSAAAEKETRYLAFQIFTYYSTDPKVASLMSNGLKERLSPGTAALRDYVLDIKQRIGTVGDRQTRLAVLLGPLCFEQSDEEVADSIARAFDLALESDVAVGFHIDDSIFWLRRKDLWSEPKNVEAMDWDGTPSTGRRLDWGRNPTEAPPQMCFNSKAIQREVQQRSALIGKAIQAGVDRLRQLKKPELFAGVIAGWETMIGQDFQTGKYLGYRALLNRGFTREHPPQDMDLEREKVVEEFIGLWARGLADAGVSPQRIYSHTAFLSHRSFKLGDKKEITYMQNKGETGYSQHNHFAPPSAAFGENHRPGFSTYPQPGLFDDIYQELAAHQQTGWGSCEGTNMQPSSGPGQTGMNMETYLAKVFNHGGTLVNVFAWGIGGEAMKKMDFRVVTEGEDALQAYRKFLKGEPLIEAAETASLMERLPPKIHKIQAELPAWIEKADPQAREQAVALMHKVEEGMKAKKLDEVEKAADSILQMMGASAPDAAQDIPAEARDTLVHKLGGPFIIFREKVQQELMLSRTQKEKLDQRLRELLPDAMKLFQKLQDMNREERGKELAAYRQKAHEGVTAMLKEILEENQQARLRQLVLQREGLFGDGELLTELEITDEQRGQFKSAIQRTNKNIEALLQEVQKGGDPEKIRPQVLKMREDLESDLESMLSDAQRKQWKQMLGKPVDLDVLFDLSSR